MSKRYDVAQPWFSKKDIRWIQKKVGEVLEGMLSTGPFVREFEQRFAEYVGVKHALCVNTCSSALEISVKVLGLQPGDEVIVPGETFIATGMAVTLNGGVPVFAEINPDTFCLDLPEIERRMTKKTKGVILVHFAGFLPPNALEIRDFCKKHGLFLIEDAAHAHGAGVDGVMAGAIGDTGCFSFFPTKTMSTGEGGMLTTNSDEVYENAKNLRERGRDWSAPTEIYTEAWRSCRVPEVCAVMGLRQLQRLDRFQEHRNALAAIYNHAFAKSADLKTLPEYKNVRRGYWKHITLIENPRLDRIRLAEMLRERHGIIINWAYSPPIHLQPVYKRLLGTREGMLPVTEAVMERHFHLPMHMKITRKDARFIAKRVLACIDALKRG